MKNFILLFTTIIIMTSCNSQTDLETLKFDSDISSIVTDTTIFEKDENIRYSFVGYVTTNIDNFKYGDVNLSKLEIKDNVKSSLIKYTSNLSIYVNNFKNNKLSGLIIKIENENEGKNLLSYMKTKLGKPLLQNIYNKDNHIQSKYLWDDKKKNQLVYITQNTEYYNNDKNSFISTEVTILKRGLKLTPDKGNNPESIKKILDENPNAFDVLEMLKSRFY
ncbi:hypothetical protein [Flavobacterium nitrogenifigens]|uniref:Lipoprotein n=1 Tax=Flavobacterium nitrogenifigens TaxID=1617283 RepID=A0A521D0M9_9FLAO|nr:hypothetical protein [Flavobacterium nitrogenifigens]KAF2332801.1 hypothetical protein DM397_10840 [Flavobacterium nitrogenifigens]SMO65249.1 hypothetical protein SAMN06265220_102871 [Flavobacterium nitrogenifigens]